ncbi:hypothetical protein C8Q76DRAFT_748748 [Earliella scabrosa]|nr:hypothetical protein C8Q76DRAFT_748748 [Earliella scabrosa]
MAYVELAAAPVNGCYLVKCDSCGKTTWKVRLTLTSSIPPPVAPCRPPFSGRHLRPSIFAPSFWTFSPADAAVRGKEGHQANRRLVRSFSQRSQGGPGESCA